MMNIKKMIAFACIFTVFQLGISSSTIAAEKKPKTVVKLIWIPVVTCMPIIGCRTTMMPFRIRVPAD